MRSRRTQPVRKSRANKKSAQRHRKSVRKSRKTVKKSARSPRKSVRRSKKSARKTTRKSIRRPKKKSVRKTTRKSVRKPRRASFRIVNKGLPVRVAIISWNIGGVKLSKNMGLSEMLSNFVDTYPIADGLDAVVLNFQNVRGTSMCKLGGMFGLGSCKIIDSTFITDSCRSLCSKVPRIQHDVDGRNVSSFDHIIRGKGPIKLKCSTVSTGLLSAVIYKESNVNFQPTMKEWCGHQSDPNPSCLIPSVEDARSFEAGIIGTWASIRNQSYFFVNGRGDIRENKECMKKITNYLSMYGNDIDYVATSGSGNKIAFAPFKEIEAPLGASDGTIAVSGYSGIHIPEYMIVEAPLNRNPRVKMVEHGRNHGGGDVDVEGVALAIGILDLLLS
jgi:hypothetical protein